MMLMRYRAMKRFVCLLLVLTTVAFTAAGCRRNNPDKKQPAVQINPDDLIKERTIADSAKEFPKLKKN